MGIFDGLFGGGKKRKQKINDALNKGAIVVDVRTKEEYSLGHVKGAHNIPLNILANEADKIKKKGKSVVTCCKSGVRSKQAVSILEAKGVDVINGGGWMAVHRIVEERKGN